MVTTVPVQGRKEMVIAYSVTPELRVKLKEPFGMLIQGSFSETMVKMENIVKKEKPSGPDSRGSHTHPLSDSERRPGPTR